MDQGVAHESQYERGCKLSEQLVLRDERHARSSSKHFHIKLDEIKLGELFKHKRKLQQHTVSKQKR